MNGQTKATQLRIVFLALDDIEDLQTAVDMLTQGKALTSGESGVAAVESVANLTLLDTPKWFFDGFKYCMALFYTES